MNECPKCGLITGVHSSTLPGCMCLLTPQRKWVGLTENEKELLWDEAVDGREHFCSQYGDFADAIEAKLKEKNHG